MKYYILSRNGRAVVYTEDELLDEYQDSEEDLILINSVIEQGRTWVTLSDAVLEIDYDDVSTYEHELNNELNREIAKELK